MANDLWQRGAAELSAAYRTGETDPIEVVSELAGRIDRLNPVLNAYVALAPDLQAQAEASFGRYRDNAPLSPLDGVPVAVKDNLHVAGLPTAWGGSTFTGISKEDELPVARLRAAGAILVGKTNTPEFAVEGYTANARFGVTRNPWDPALTPGGSSGGTVSAVAAGLATLGIGTDGGGSTRRPAGHTGLYGLKPTIGRIARSGGLPQVLMDFEVIGPFARNIRDLRLLYGALAGPDRRDPASRSLPLSARPDAPLRILSVPRLGSHPCDPAILSATRRLARRLAEAGHLVEEADLPIDLSEIDAFWGAFGQIGLAHLRDTVPAMHRNAGALYLGMADTGAGIPASALFGAIGAVQRLRAATSCLFADWDVILMPTAAAQPWPAGQSHPEEIDGQTVGPRGHAIYTGWVNASGHPALAVPAGFDGAGLPIGCQLIGDLGAENLLMDVAGALSAGAESWRWPDLALRSGDAVQAK
ncbi:amidase [Sedimentitalea sp. JM2-8]|uniref:Amidase n=1 Tax=Sedimentitalea xiamensis TaxID=3050037 RepID=A0ABT7FIU4_9RHOB|nr:amidase [Sedimentitalea xiamensis]MDK3074998.1 amidase [Sedimentitalea xiamensis]